MYKYFFFPINILPYIPRFFLPTGNYYFALVFLVLYESSFLLILEFLHFSVVKCERPELKHGVIVSGSREKFSYQAVVIFGCLQGFYLNGSNVVFCSGNNTWEPEIPKCIKGTDTAFFLLL